MVKQELKRPVQCKVFPGCLSIKTDEALEIIQLRYMLKEQLVTKTTASSIRHVS